MIHDTKIISFINLKGGVGKTTLCGIIGYTLHEKGYNVLLFDLDPQASLTSLFLSEPISSREETMNKLFSNGTITVRRILSTKRGVLDLVPSSPIIFSFYWRNIGTYPEAQILFQMFRNPNYEGLYRKTRATLRKYDFVLIDAPPDVLFSRYAAYAADYIIIPVDITELSVFGTKIVVKEILPHVINSRPYSNLYPLRLLGLIFNRIPKLTEYGYTRRFEKIKKMLMNAITRITTSNPEISEYIYVEPLFEQYIPQRTNLIGELSWVIHKRKREPPVTRIMKDPQIRDIVSSLTDNVIKRINNFIPMKINK